jgi:chemotaxis protein MotB
MKKSLHFGIIISLVIGAMLMSCGPGKKLVASQARVDKLERDSSKTHSQLNDCNTVVKNLNAETAKLQNEYSTAQNDLAVLATESNLTIVEQAKRLKSLQNVIQSQKDVLNNLKNSIADALMNYKTDELYVYTKDGCVYVSLEEKLLFKSGSDVVDPKGKEALKSLATVLSSTKDISVMIEGHTDNVPIKNKLFKDNWDLSTARATSIVRILTDANGFDATRIAASGKGKFHPVKTNDTEEGRAANRRTEVILSPDLKELYRILYQ